MNTKITDSTVSILEKGDENIWEEFAGSAVNATIYHSISFLDYYAFKVKEVCKLVFRNKGKIVALLPAGVIEKDGQRKLYSPFSASFSGFCYNAGIGIEQALIAVTQLKQYAIQHDINQIVIQQPPQIYYKFPSEIFDYAFMQSGLALSNYDVSHYLVLGPDIFANFSSSTKWAINKLLKNKGIKSEINDDKKGVFELIQNHRKTKNISFTYQFNEIQQLSFLTNRVYFFGLRLADSLIAACYAYAVNDRCLLCMHWAHLEEMTALRPMSLLIYQISRWATEHNFSYMDLGTSTSGGSPNYGLSDFKEQFGPAKILRRSWSINL